MRPYPLEGYFIALVTVSFVMHHSSVCSNRFANSSLGITGTCILWVTRQNRTVSVVLMSKKMIALLR